MALDLCLWPSVSVGVGPTLFSSASDFGVAAVWGSKNALDRLQDRTRARKLASHPATKLKRKQPHREKPCSAANQMPADWPRVCEI